MVLQTLAALFAIISPDLAVFVAYLMASVAIFLNLLGHLGFFADFQSHSDSFADSFPSFLSRIQPL